MAGPRGYPDWQRIENWDSPVLYSENQINHVAQWNTGILDVSHYGYLGGVDNTTNGRINVSISWFADSAGTVFVGGRAFRLSPNIITALQYRLPNLGPFVKITYTPLDAGTTTHSAVLIGTNRTHPLENIPTEIPLIKVFTQNINAGATLTLFPGSYYAGPVRVWIHPPAAGNTFQLQTMDSVGATQIVDAITLAAGDQSFDTVAPSGAWWVNIGNTAGVAGNASCSVTPSMTGSL